MPTRLCGWPSRHQRTSRQEASGATGRSGTFEFEAYGSVRSCLDTIQLQRCNGRVHARMCPTVIDALGLTARSTNPTAAGAAAAWQEVLGRLSAKIDVQVMRPTTACLCVSRHAVLCAGVETRNKTALFTHVQTCTTQPRRQSMSWTSHGLGRAPAKVNGPFRLHSEEPKVC